MYYSHWILLLVVVWSIGYLGKITLITDYLHLQTSALFALIGFSCLMVYYLLVKQYPIDITLVGALWLSHYIPYEMVRRYSKQTHSTEVFCITMIVYLVYLMTMDTTLFDVYIQPKQFTEWSEVFQFCRSKDFLSFPTCSIVNLIKKII